MPAKLALLAPTRTKSRNQSVLLVPLETLRKVPEVDRALHVTQAHTHPVLPPAPGARLVATLTGRPQPRALPVPLERPRKTMLADVDHVLSANSPLRAPLLVVRVPQATTLVLVPPLARSVPLVVTPVQPEPNTAKAVPLAATPREALPRVPPVPGAGTCPVQGHPSATRLPTAVLHPRALQHSGYVGRVSTPLALLASAPRVSRENTPGVVRRRAIAA